MGGQFRTHLLIAIALVAVPLPLFAQEPFPPTPANDPLAMVHGPEWLIGFYLMHRNVVTREQPVLVMCGAGASSFLTPAVTKDWVVTHKYVDSIVVDPNCNRTTEHDFGRGRHPLRLQQVVLGHDSLYVVAFAEPFSAGAPPYAHGWWERFVVPGPGPTGFGRLLIYNFRPPD